MDHRCTITRDEANTTFTAKLNDYPDIEADGGTEAAAIAALRAKIVTLSADGYFNYPKEALITIP